jgi:hypothetical protein
MTNMRSMVRGAAATTAAAFVLDGAAALAQAQYTMKIGTVTARARRCRSFSPVFGSASGAG